MRLPELTPDQRRRGSAYLLGLQAQPERRELSLYEGRLRVGSIVVDEMGRAERFDEREKSLGIFTTLKAAIQGREGGGKRRKKAAP